MTVGLDATYSTGRNLSGVGVYSREIMRGLADAYPRENFLHCYRPHRLIRGLLDPRPANCAPRPLFEEWQPWHADLFHGLNQRLPATRCRRSVVTFHDLFVLTAEYSTPDFRRRFTRISREAASRADLVICVSQSTADQVSQLLNVDPARLRVIHHGVRIPRRWTAGVAREPLVLHVGAIQKRKNLVRLVEAFESAAPPPWRLVLAGSDGFGAAEVHARIHASPARNRITTTGWIDDRRLLELYQTSSILAFPSLDEGFGIPVLEGMAHGLAVLASTRGALPEVCGDAALLVNPLQTDDITGALRDIIRNPDLKRHLEQKGILRAREFGWPKAVEKTWAVYQELIEGGP